jgi:TPP-dependent pyruvate/acetoin dehydrogenase alpha subunit
MSRTSTHPDAPRPKKAESSPHGLGAEQLLELYYCMRLTRSLEQRLVNLYPRTTDIVKAVRRPGSY